MANITGKTIGELTELTGITSDTLFPVELSGVTYHVPYSSITSSSTYKVYSAIIRQNGINDPTATVLENTLGGTLVWTRDSAGTYLATLSGAFPDINKVLIFLTDRYTNLYLTPFTRFVAGRNNNNSIYVQSSAITQDGAKNIVVQPQDSLFDYIPIEIRVYQ